MCISVLKPKTLLCSLGMCGYFYLPLKYCKEAEDAGLAQMSLGQYAKPDPWKFSRETRSVLKSVKLSVIS